MLNRSSEPSKSGCRALRVRLLHPRYHRCRVKVAKNGADLSYTKAYCRCQRRVGFVTAITSNLLPNSHAWSVAGVLRMLTICALRNQRHWVARSVTSSLSRSVAGTIARCIAVETRPRGGTRLVLILPKRLASFG